MTLAQELESHLPVGRALRFGQLNLSHMDEGSFEACHLDDKDGNPGLREVNSVRELREIAKFDANGEYRPLKTAPTLITGWKTTCDNAVEFLKRLDAIYPAVFATWITYERGELQPTPLRRTLERQTGMYRFAGTITDPMANRIMRELCFPGCIRKIAWPLDDNNPVSRIKPEPNAIPAICIEACTFAINQARTLAKEAFEKSQGSDALTKG